MLTIPSFLSQTTHLLWDFFASTPQPTPVHSLEPPPLSELAHIPLQRLPRFVQQSPAALRYLSWLGQLDWSHLPGRDPHRPWPGRQPEPRTPYLAAFLIKIDQQLRCFSHLRAYLLDHPPLIWCLGFPLVADPTTPWGFNPAASLPSAERFSRVLRSLSQPQLQFLLDCTVQLIQQALPPGLVLGDEISLDTKHILAWVKENNPKQFVEHRFDPTQQPAGDPDCRLGCKKRANTPPDTTTMATPTQEGLPASGLDVGKGQFYWGYASGIITTKLPGLGEFVLAELTQTFDKSDISYFFPLLQEVERRLGRRPRFGAFDAAFDAFYVYDYFHQAGGFAAVPFVDRGNTTCQSFNIEGLPLCAAGLPMPLKSTFQANTSLYPHQKGRYACPLWYPQPTGQECPVKHHKWPEGGCLSTIPTSIGARIRHQLDRESDAYKALYNQRTASERINSQAVELGIERPKLRNQASIANHNSLLYVVINLHALQRLKSRVAQLPAG